MGYRSDLYALVHGKDLIAFTSALSDHDFLGYFDEIQEQDIEGYTRFQTNYSLKWYDTYTDVMAVNAVFINSDLSVMLRVGEEPGDTEYIGSEDLGDSFFSITYRVDVDF